MHPVAHLVITAAVSRRPYDLMMGLAPDIPNIAVLCASEWCSEQDPRVLMSRISHSPITVLVVLLATQGRGWAYALHWFLDALSHPSYQWMYPFLRKKD